MPTLGLKATDDLDQLLEAERRLAERFDQTRAAASRLLEVARADALALDRRAEESERAGRARIEAETAAEFEAELRRIEAQADEGIQTYTRVTGEELRRLSLFVLRALLEDAAPVPR